MNVIISGGSTTDFPTTVTCVYSVFIVYMLN